VSIELYNANNHVCIAFRNLVTGQAVQSNQFLIVDNGSSALIDPGGDLTYSRLYVALGRYTSVKHLEFVIASHQDPDIVASINKWLVGTGCKVVVPGLWERFIPHFVRPGKLEDRQVSIPDEGGKLSIGNFELMALPAHFLHAEGNFHFYDPVSKILFSGDVAANMPPSDTLDEPARSLEEVLPFMESFHRRYMNSNKACRYWAAMVEQLDIRMLVPQHGRALTGKAIGEFIHWLAQLQCGLDLMTQDNYRLPRSSFTALHPN
jgi:flavorubredoxin